MFCDIDNKAIVFINITLFIIMGYTERYMYMYVVEYVNMLSLQNIYLDQGYAYITVKLFIQK